MPSAVNSKDIEDLINNLKSGISLWEDLIAKSSKFSNSIKYVKYLFICLIKTQSI